VIENRERSHFCSRHVVDVSLYSGLVFFVCFSVLLAYFSYTVVVCCVAYAMSLQFISPSWYCVFKPCRRCDRCWVFFVAGNGETTTLSYLASNFLSGRGEMSRLIIRFACSVLVRWLAVLVLVLRIDWLIIDVFVMRRCWFCGSLMVGFLSLVGVVRDVARNTGLVIIETAESPRRAYSYMDTF